MENIVFNIHVFQSYLFIYGYKKKVTILFAKCAPNHRKIFTKYSKIEKKKITKSTK